MAKKTTARRKPKAKSVAITDALVKKAIKGRNNKTAWPELCEELGIPFTNAAISALRARMKEVDPGSVQGSGPRGSGSKKTSAKKTTGKKKVARRRPGKKAARKRSGSPRVEEA